MSSLWPGATVIEGDLFRIETLHAVLERVDIVVHLAAEMDFFPNKPSELYKVRPLALASPPFGLT